MPENILSPAVVDCQHYRLVFLSQKLSSKWHPKCFLFDSVSKSYQRTGLVETYLYTALLQPNFSPSPDICHCLIWYGTTHCYNLLSLANCRLSYGMVLPRVSGWSTRMAHKTPCWTYRQRATCHRALNDKWPQLRMGQRYCRSQLVAPRLWLPLGSPREVLRHPVARKMLPEWGTSSSEVGIGKDCGWSERVKEGCKRKRWGWLMSGWFRCWCRKL